MADTGELYARGLKRRKEMFGDADVEKRMAASGEFGAPLQNIINAYVYGDVWERDGLSGRRAQPGDARDHRGQQSAGRVPRPCQGRAGERLHGAQVQDVLLLIAMYCGIPAAIEPNQIAAEIFGKEPT